MSIDGCLSWCSAPTASAGRRPALLYIHGGGMITGSPKTEAAGSGQLARELDAVVDIPGLPPGPRAPFPRRTRRLHGGAALDAGQRRGTRYRPGPHRGHRIQCRWRTVSSGRPAGPRRGVRLARPGSRLPDARRPYRAARRPAAGAASCGHRSPIALGGPLTWAGTPRMSDAPEYAAPARREDLSGLAPAWVGVGDLDLFYDESVDYARRLQAAGVDCELVTVPGMYHGADGLARKDPAMTAFRRGVVDHLLTRLVSRPC